MSDSQATFSGPGVGRALGSLALPADLVQQLEREAKASKKTVTQLIGEWLEDQRDGREAMKVLKRIKDGKEKAIPAAEVYARLGI